TTEPRAPFSGHPRSNACSRSPLQRSHARRSHATHGPTRARGPRYNGATRAVLRPPTVQRVLAVPATASPRAPFSGHPPSHPYSRSPLQRSHARRSQATHGPTRAPGPRYNGATRAVLRPPSVQRLLAAPATTEPRAPFSGHPRSNACSRSPLQRSHARRSQATHGPTRARGPRYKDPCSGYRFRGRRPTAYNRTLSETAAGRAGGVVLLALLAAVVVVPSLPADPGAVRLAGVGVLWWF